MKKQCCQGKLTQLDITEVLISKNVIDTYTSHDDFVSINNVLREYIEVKEEVKNRETSLEYTMVQEQYYIMKEYCD